MLEKKEHHKKKSDFLERYGIGSILKTCLMPKKLHVSLLM
jgi:hypothetical protein